MCWHDRIISSCPYPFCLLWKSCSEEFLNGSILTDLTWFWNITIHFLQENYLWWNYLPTTLPPFIRTSSASVLVDFSIWYGWRSFLVPCEDVSEFCIFVTKGKKKGQGGLYQRANKPVVDKLTNRLLKWSGVNRVLNRRLSGVCFSRKNSPHSVLQFLRITSVLMWRHLR